METKWLEDFVSLAETRSFSRSAQLRHVTQPAFSRRIQALGGLGRHRPGRPQLLPHAPHASGRNAVQPVAWRCCRRLQCTRAMLRGHTSAGQDVIEIRRAAHAGLHLLPGLGQQPAREVRPDQEPAHRAQRARRGAAPGGRQLRPADRLPPRLPAFPAGRRTVTKWCRLGQEVLAPLVRGRRRGRPRVQPAGAARPAPALPGLCARRLPGPRGGP